MKIFIRILVVVIILVLLVKLLTEIVFEPWLVRIIDSELNEENRNYISEIDKLHILIAESTFSPKLF